MFFLTVALALLIVILVCKVKLSRRHVVWSTFPRPQGVPFLHNSLKLLGDRSKDMLGTLTQWRDELGEVFLITRHPFDCGFIVVSDPVVAEAISFHQPDRTRCVGYKALCPWIGENQSFLASGERLKQKIKLPRNALKPKMISSVSLSPCFLHTLRIIFFSVLRRIE
jgi:hypothetical protein